MTDYLRIVDEIRLLRVEPYEEAHREHLAGQVEKLIGELDRLRDAGGALADAAAEVVGWSGLPQALWAPLADARDAWRSAAGEATT